MPPSHKGVFENASKTPFPFRRLVVLGTTGSGKTTLAAALAECLNLVHIELDALHWEEGWVEAPDGVFRARVVEALRAPAWVADGNYRTVRPLILARSEAILWLDYPIWVNLWRLLKRTIRRGWTREVIWNGNVEPFWIHWKIWSEESLFHWLFKTWGKRRREYGALFASDSYAHAEKIRFTSPAEAETWLQAVCRAQTRLDPSPPSR